MYKRAMCIILTCIVMTISISYAEESIENIQAGGQSAIVMDVETGRILYEKNIYSKLPMASTTKIMTALLAIEHIPLDKKVKINSNAQGIEGSSIYLKTNEELKAVDIIYGLMLRSGNDAAVAIAYEISGSIEAFAELMNKKAKEIGANDTNFVNPSGLHDNNHYTTAYDLGLITREALKNPTFKEIVKTKFYTADRDGYKHFANKNKNLDICEGGDGVKTGYTIKSGRCLVASATRDDMQLIAITLNDYDWFDTTKMLLDQSFNIYKPYLLFNKNQIITKVNVENGTSKQVSISVFKESIIPLNEEEEEKLLTVIDIPKVLHAPIKSGQRVGKMTTYLDRKIINTSYLIANESIEKQTFKDKIKDFLKIGK